MGDIGKVFSVITREDVSSRDGSVKSETEKRRRV